MISWYVLSNLSNYKIKWNLYSKPKQWAVLTYENNKYDWMQKQVHVKSWFFFKTSRRTKCDAKFVKGSDALFKMTSAFKKQFQDSKEYSVSFFPTNVVSHLLSTACSYFFRDFGGRKLYLITKER